MELQRTLFLFGTFVLGTVAEDIISLGKDSFVKEVAKIPHFVMFVDQGFE